MSYKVLGILMLILWVIDGYGLRRRFWYALMWFALFPVVVALLGVPLPGSPAVVDLFGIGLMLTYGLWGYVLLFACGDRWVYWFFALLVLTGIAVGMPVLVVAFLIFLFWSVAEILAMKGKLGLKVVMGFVFFCGGVGFVS